MGGSQWIGVEADWMLKSDDPVPFLISVSPAVRALHWLILGSSGFGKTVLLQNLIALDLEQGRSVLVLDMRGDMVRAVIELCARLGVDHKRVRIIDLREKRRPFGFNPLAGKGEAYFRALAVLHVAETESSSFGIQLAETLRYALLLLTEGGSDLTHLEHLFDDRAFRLNLLKTCTNESVVNFWTRYDSLSRERQIAMAMPVLNKLSLLLSTKTVRQILGHPTPIDLAGQLNTPGSITLVSLSVDELHGAARMMAGLILKAVCREAFARVDVPESERTAVRCYVDEFSHFGGEDFEGILAEGRRFRFTTALAFQSLVQVSPRLRSMILGNVGMKVIFRCGREDSAVLSRDLFGSPTAYDFTDIPTGYAVLWTRDQAAVEIEVNEPLVKDVGRLSPEAVAFLDTVYSQAGEPRRDSASPRLEVAPSVTEPRPRASRKPDLEDWLADD